MDVQTAFDILLGTVGALGGWVLNRVNSEVHYLRDLLLRQGQELSDVRVEYVLKTDLQLIMGRVLDALQRIEDKLDRKVDKD